MEDAMEDGTKMMEREDNKLQTNHHQAILAPNNTTNLLNDKWCAACLLFIDAFNIVAALTTQLESHGIHILRRLLFGSLVRLHRYIRMGKFCACILPTRTEQKCYLNKHPK
jgi:hypothetical protein